MTRNIILALIPFVLVYLLWSFASWDLNPAAWGEDKRLGAVFLGGFFSGATLLFNPPHR